MAVFNVKFTSILAIVSDLVTVGGFMFVLFPFFGGDMVLITTMFVWCGTALRV